MALVLRRAVLFITFVLLWALVAAAVAQASTRRVVVFEGYPPGTIVVKTHERRLYYVLDGYHALRFPVGVGRRGMQWTGLAHVEGKFIRPAWEAPPSIRRENPRLPLVIPGVRHPRHQPSVVDRPLRLARLHPHVQPRHRAALPDGPGRHAGDRRTVTASRRHWIKGLAAEALVAVLR